jgi:uncharacterized protein YeaO (DUF488 family)
MKLDVFDTYVTQDNGERMHFDVLLPQGSTKQQAEICAIQWLKNIKIPTNNIHLDRCNFCHSEVANSEIEQIVSGDGYAILQLEGCPSAI